MDRVQQSAPPATDESKDPFFYGWRVVRRILPDGTESYEEVPLTEEDVLFPQEEDHFIQTPDHTRDFIYCHDVLEAHYAVDPSVVVTGDRRIDWCVPGIRPMGPDIVVFFDVHNNRRAATFSLLLDGGRPVVVLEITSPSTHNVDVGRKIDLYYQAGIEKYVLVDRGPSGDELPRLRGYQRGDTGWVPMEMDAQGRLGLAPVGFSIGLEDGRAWLYDTATGERAPDRSEWLTALQQAKDEARQADERAREARVRADEESRARTELEQRLHELEAKLKNQSGNGG